VITDLDTNILLDILIPGAPHAQTTQQQLAETLQAGSLVISEAVYSELASFFPDQVSLDQFLQRTSITLDPSRPESLFRAGAAWHEYQRQRPAAFACPQCGNRQRTTCSRCGADLRPRQHLVADFMIGAHALVQADRLLTRDRRYYGTYFPRLVLV